MTGTNFLKMLAAGAATLALLAGSAGMALGKDTTVYAPRHDDDARTVRVGYADLNLASAEGRKRLTFRVGGAVDQVCDTQGSGIDFEGQYCAARAWNGARPQMERAFARAIEISQTGHSSIAPVAIAIIGAAR
jgi:UrcA family protein